jgi:RNA polymerase sigma factor (TIGR02999 family)
VSVTSETALTTLLESWQRGNGAAFAQVFDKAYEELRRIAAGRLRQGGGNLSLAPTDLLHEAVLRVVDTPIQFESRSHFYASMSLYMRGVLVDHARARQAEKRGGDRVQVTYTESGVADESQAADLLALDQALKQLAALDARGADILHLTYFAGLEREEIAKVLKISVPTVDRDLRFARAWLNKNMEYGI